MSIARKISVIIPVHDDDIIRNKNWTHGNKNKQWFTRDLYAAYAPFNYNLLLDAHVLSGGVTRGFFTHPVLPRIRTF